MQTKHEPVLLSKTTIQRFGSVLFENTLCCLCNSKTRYVVCAVRKYVMLSVPLENMLCCLCCSKTRYVFCAFQKHIMLSVHFENTLCCLCSSKTRNAVCAVRKHAMLSVQFKNTSCCLLRLSRWRTYCPAWSERSTVSEILQEGRAR